MNYLYFYDIIKNTKLIFYQIYKFEIKEVMIMLYMVIEKYKNKEAVYKRFREKGRMMPEGVSYVNSWVSEDGNTCYQINEAQNEELLYEWSSNWNDVTDFAFIPVINSQEMSDKMANKQTTTNYEKRNIIRIKNKEITNIDKIDEIITNANQLIIL